MSTVVPFGLCIITNAATNANARGHSDGFSNKQERCIYEGCRNYSPYICTSCLPLHKCVN